ncbi:hypothetical protein ABW21_db0201807 [Orbilia brochopaga]|nr:hypothetical protein ABW21_db0201807 [Drechslerella brochopaga]
MPILKAIAFVLATESGDVAAVAASLKGDSVEIYFARNKAFNSGGQGYLCSLVSTVRNKCTYTELLSCIIGGCKAKITKRLEKIRKSLLTSRPPDFETSSFAARARLEVVFEHPQVLKSLGIRKVPAGRRFSNRLQAYWKALSERFLHKGDVETDTAYWGALITASYHLGESKAQVVIGQVIHRGLKKLGFYATAARYIIHYSKDRKYESRIAKLKFIDVGSGQVYPKKASHRPIKAIDAVPASYSRKRILTSRSPSPSRKKPRSAPQLRSLAQPGIHSGSMSCIQTTGKSCEKSHGYLLESIPKNSSDKNKAIETLNWVAQAEKLQAVCVAKLNHEYPDFEDHYVKFSPDDLIMHAQCAVALFMRERFPWRNHIEIGMSKLCCWPCDQWLKAFAGRDTARCSFRVDKDVEPAFFHDWRAMDSVTSRTADMAVMKAAYEYLADYAWELQPDTKSA